MKAFLLIVSLILIFCGCRNFNEKINAELEKFDNSLDSLINDDCSGQPQYCIFGIDTLKNSPKQIREIYYMKIDEDSMLVDANCHVYKFANNELVINSSEDCLGRKYVQKYMYFKNNMDNNLIQTLRNNYKNSDTLIFGCLKQYNSVGKLVKEVNSGVWKEKDKNTGATITNENRLLEVYIYNPDSGFYTTYRKSYFNKKYNPDSLRLTAIQKFNTRIKPLKKPDPEYSYTYDSYGNWIVRRRINNTFPDVVYRIITYR